MVATAGTEPERWGTIIGTAADGETVALREDSVEDCIEALLIGGAVVGKTVGSLDMADSIVVSSCGDAVLSLCDRTS